MSVHNKNGASLAAVYDMNGSALPTAYNVFGREIYTESLATLKIMTYNVGQWYVGDGSRVPSAQKAEYYNLQTGIFNRHQPDVLCLQEYMSTWCEDGSNSSELLSDFSYQNSTNDTNAYKGHSILTRGFEMSNYTSHNFSVNKGNYPTFESVEITVSGKTITIVNTHNDYVLDPYQEQEVTDLLAFLANLNSFVLCGDFNINLSTQDTTDDQYTNSVKRFLDAGYNVGNCVVDWIPTYFGTSSPTGGKFTDQFVTSSDIIIKKLYADTTKLTDGIDDKIDHLPLIAILTIGADAT